MKSNSYEELTHFPVGAVVFPTTSCCLFFAGTIRVLRTLEQGESVLLLGRLFDAVPCCRVLTCRGEVGEIVEHALLSGQEA